MVLEREIKAKAVVRFWRREEKREESVLLPKPERLSKASEIKATLKTRQYFSSTPLLSLVARDNARACSRLVVVTPKKLGNAATELILMIKDGATNQNNFVSDRAQSK